MVWTSLGHCPRCMHKAFLTAAGSWIGVALINLTAWTHVIVAAKIAAFGLTMFWMTHIIVFGTRISASHKAAHVASSCSETLALSRRSAASVFARALALAAFGTALPLPAGAQSCVCYCGGTSWSIGASACQGGQKTRCVDSPNGSGNCGWMSLNQRCDAGENCKG